MKAAQKERTNPLSHVVTIPPKSYPSANVENDNIITLNDYFPSASALEIVERFAAGLRGAKSGRMISITGPYGSGKSTMATFLSGLLASSKSKEWKVAHNILKKEPSNYEHALVYARKKAEVHQSGMIRCVITARREPISVTLMRALHSGLQKHLESNPKATSSPVGLIRQCERNLKNGKAPDSITIMKIIDETVKIAPTVIIIDEFGKNIEYFTTDESQQSDLFLLQELAEKSGRSHGIPLSIVTLQHMAFDEYAVGTSVAQKREWAKIQGRFEDIPFANSPDQTRLLISNTIKLGNTAAYKRGVRKWAEKESTLMQDLGISASADPALIASCYPLSPLALEVLPELCFRYGQHERTLLSFISDSGRHTVATFIDENQWDAKSPPSMGIDILYDYFIAGTNMIHSSSRNISRLMEVETLIRDAHGLSIIETKTLKAIGILNLIGRSGYLRASRRMIDYAIGASSRSVLDALEQKSIITYRNHSDEYRLWHGTDIDIASKMDAYRKRYRRASLSVLLMDTVRMEPVVAAKHGIEKGTMRLFERRFELDSDHTQDQRYDGVILYITDNTEPIRHERPVITVRAGSTTELRFAAIEVSAIRDILESDDDVTSDRVARGELEERLADAEVVLDREFGLAYGDTAQWTYEKDGTKTRLYGTPNMIVSKVCDVEYLHTPIMRNEMINRTDLSGQGASARRKILEAMITRQNEPRFGIEGYGPERAIYEAVIYENGIHVQSKSRWTLKDPKNEMCHVWNAMFNAIKNTKGRIVLTDIYNIAKSTPYGTRDGPLQLLVVAMILIHKDNIALYEHGTFTPRLQPEVSERMAKNPEYFELKYFKNTQSKKAILNQIAIDLYVDANGVLDIVGHIARIVAGLSPYIKHTKNLDAKTVAVRNAILGATEPDTLLFESLPKALGFKTPVPKTSIKKFSSDLAKSVKTLQSGFENMLGEIESLLFDMTGISERSKLSDAAKSMKRAVTDQNINVFLEALSADALERRDDWIKYVAMSLTDTPPDNWNDDHRAMFENRLYATSSTFTRLAGMHFSAVSDNFSKQSSLITITHADGSEYHNIISSTPEQQKKTQSVIRLIKKELGKNKMDKNYVGALIQFLTEELK